MLEHDKVNADLGSGLCRDQIPVGSWPSPELAAPHPATMRAGAQ